MRPIAPPVDAGNVFPRDAAAVDEACGIESARLLAERYVKEMEDDAQTPRLLDILVRSEI